MCMTQVQLVTVVAIIQKHSFTDDLQNRCSKKLRNIHRNTPVLESLFNKVAGKKLFLKISQNS